MRSGQTILVAGAAGFIGSHLVDRLLGEGCMVVGIDNLSRGRTGNLSSAMQNDRFQFIECDLTSPDFELKLTPYRFDMVWHMVANSDIAAGAANPEVDLKDTFLSTFHLLAYMRKVRIGKLAFASTSAVYGLHEEALHENTGPLFPISNYGAMKLASEAMVSSALESFLEQAWIFRFPNVVGARATHGIIFDLLSKLKKNSNQLEVLGDGKQQKPYLHVSELVDAMFTICARASEKLNWFNIGPADDGVTVLWIAQTVAKAAAPQAEICFTGGTQGWPGDVPKFSYSIRKLQALGWSPHLGSGAAIEKAVAEIKEEILFATA